MRNAITLMPAASQTSSFINLVIICGWRLLLSSIVSDRVLINYEIKCFEWVWAERSVQILDLFPVFSFAMTSELDSYGSVMIPHCSIFKYNTSYVFFQVIKPLIVANVTLFEFAWVEVCA